MNNHFYFNNAIATSPSPSLDPSSENSNDEGSMQGESPSGFFEGPEKTMEVVFLANVGVDDGLRALSRVQLDELCTLAKCTILTKIASNYIDAYVLSESSLFVYKYKYIMKTCGTTTLLRCLNKLLQFADALGMEVVSVVYSRKNLTCPGAQLWPHSNFGDEIKYISSHANLQERLHGSGYILGPVTGDHWFVYVADLETNGPTALAARLAGDKEIVAKLPIFESNIPRTLTPATLFAGLPASASSKSLPGDASNRTINMMMFDLAPDFCQIFFKQNTETGKEMTKKSGIAELCPGALIDETAFTPCGYSMNGILHDAYYTIHITPEQAFSYASFETNTVMPNYLPLVRNALKVFRPRRFVLTMFGEEFGINSIKELPTSLRRLDLPGFGSYLRTSEASTKVTTELCCLMACFTLEALSIKHITSSQGVLLITEALSTTQKSLHASTSKTSLLSMTEILPLPDADPSQLLAAASLEGLVCPKRARGYSLI